jgi:hypothetical protein
MQTKPIPTDMKSRQKLVGLGATVLASAVGLQAEVKINDNLAVSGYAVAAAATSDPDKGSGDDTFFNSGTTNLDAVKVALTGTYDALSGKVSLFYVPESNSGNSEAGLLDGYATYTAGDVSFTGGKFLSYLGYEAWDPINMSTITYGNSWATIPGYHSGGKIDFAGEGFALGAAVTDSLYMDADHFFGGDGDFGNGLGYELYANFTGVEGLTIFAGLGLEDLDDGIDIGGVLIDQVLVGNLWASYALTETFTFAAEYTYTDFDSVGFGSEDTHRYALFGIYTFSDAISATARISGVLDDEQGTGFTIAPTYTINELFSVRAEATYADSEEGGVQFPGTKGFFYAVQGVFKF